jgi:hypothetical protein
MPKAKASDAQDPNRLIRSKAGTYRTADDRFEVRQAALGWFLIDSSSTDELGQELTRGPFPTLKAVSAEVPEARRTTIKPLPRTRAIARQAQTASTARRRKPTPVTTWLDRLPDAEAAAARRLIRALTLEGVEDADALVRAARKATEPVVARRVLEHRLASLLDELPQKDREGARKFVARVAELVASDGISLFNPLPGWALVEVPAGEEAPGRRVVPKLTRR